MWPQGGQAGDATSCHWSHTTPIPHPVKDSSLQDARTHMKKLAAGPVFAGWSKEWPATEGSGDLVFLLLFFFRHLVW